MARSRIFKSLTQKIIRNELTPGQRINEDGLAKEFSVSRTPIREALILLEKQGLVENEKNRGFSVVTISVEGMRAYLETARVVYKHAFETAAGRIKPVLRDGSLDEGTLEQQMDAVLEDHLNLVTSAANAGRNALIADTVIRAETFFCFALKDILMHQPTPAALEVLDLIRRSDRNLEAALVAGKSAPLAGAIQETIDCGKSLVTMSFA